MRSWNWHPSSREENNGENIVIIQHDLGYTATYSGLVDVLVKKYDRVDDKASIGISFEESIKYLDDTLKNNKEVNNPMVMALIIKSIVKKITNNCEEDSLIGNKGKIDADEHGLIIKA